MDKNQWNEALAKLKEELNSVTEVDDSTREILRRVDDDIHRILQTPGEVPPAHHANLRESLENSIEYLEASHPAITGLMNRLIKALSDMGI